MAEGGRESTILGHRGSPLEAPGLGDAKNPRFWGAGARHWRPQGPREANNPRFLRVGGASGGYGGLRIYCRERVWVSAKSIFATPLMKYLTGGKTVIAKQIEYLTSGDKNLILAPVPSDNNGRSRIYNKNTTFYCVFFL